MLLGAFIFSIVLLGLQSLVYFTFIRFLKTTKFYKPNHRWWILVPFILFNGPFIVIMFTFGRSFDPPDWFKSFAMQPFYVWQAATFFIALWLLIGKLIKLPFQLPVWTAKIFKPLREKIKNFSRRKTVSKVSYSRRQFVKYSTGFISAYAFTGAGYGVLKHDNYEINYKDIHIENLPRELRGTTLTLISDLHSGQYMSEKDIREYTDVINELNSDIVCIPGDFVNFERDEVKAVVGGFRDLKAKEGIYGALGNHDFFMDPDYVASAISNESPVRMLRNQFAKLNIKGKPLYILGLDDTRSSGGTMDKVVLDSLDKLNGELLTNENDYKDAPKILLCHKPYSFEELAKRDMDLILSGHTHGGQVVPFKMGNINISFAALVSKYIEGHFVSDKSNMYISRGLGSVGLPIRINCPPEITKITLV